MCGTFTGGTGEDVFPGASYDILAAGGSEIMRWGFDFGRSRLTINARAETATTTFGRIFGSGRCIVRVSGFYEWSKDKHKYYYTSDGEMLLCGLCRKENRMSGRAVQQDIFALLSAAQSGAYAESSVELPQKSFVVITTAANASVANVHERMPLMIDGNRADEWLYDDSFARAHLSATMPMFNATECVGR